MVRMLLRNALPYIRKNDEMISDLDLSNAVISTADALELEQVPICRLRVCDEEKYLYTERY